MHNEHMPLHAHYYHPHILFIHDYTLIHESLSMKQHPLSEVTMSHERHQPNIELEAPTHAVYHLLLCFVREVMMQ